MSLFFEPVWTADHEARLKAAREEVHRLLMQREAFERHRAKAVFAAEAEVKRDG